MLFDFRGATFGSCWQPLLLRFIHCLYAGNPKRFPHCLICSFSSCSEHFFFCLPTSLIFGRGLDLISHPINFSFFCTWALVHLWARFYPGMWRYKRWVLPALPFSLP